MFKKPRALASFLILCIISASSRDLLAQSSSTSSGRPTIAVAGFRSSGHPVEEKFRQSLISKLESESSYTISNDVVAKQAVDKILKADLSDSLDKIENAKKAFAKGKELYDQLSLDEAVRYLRQAVDNYRDGIAAIRQNKDLLMSYLYLGMALIILGRNDEGEKYIREMVLLDTERNTKELSSRDFSPQVINTHREITKQVLGSPSGTLEITMTPPSAKLYLDGAPVNMSSLGNLAVPAGKHSLVAEQRGYRVYSKTVVIRPGANQFDIALEMWQPFSTYAAERRSSSIVLDDLNSTAREIPASILVLGSIAQSSTAGNVIISSQLYDTRTQEFSAIEKVSAPMDKADSQAKGQAKALLAKLNKKGEVMADVGGKDPKLDPKPYSSKSNIPEPVDEGGGSIYKKWWFWTGIAAVVGGGAAAYFLLMRSGGTSDPSIQVENPF